MTDTNINERLYNRNQTWHYTVSCRLNNGYLVRARIERNAYDFQSGIYGEFLTAEAGWKQAEFMPIEGAECEHVSYVTKNPDINLFRLDAGSMFQMLELSVGSLPPRQETTK